MLQQNTKNILFDLGGVLLNLDFNRCLKSFEALGFKDVDKYLSRFHPSGIFHAMECGKIGTDEFIVELNKANGLNIEPEKVIKAWNSFLMDIPRERLELLAKLKTKYNLYLLSNTSPAHAKTFEEKFALNDNFSSINHFFDQVFYSFEIGVSKPHEDAYKRVLEVANIKANETVFIDDSKINTDAANKLGFNSIVVDENFQINSIDFENIQKNATFASGIVNA